MQELYDIANKCTLEIKKEIEDWVSQFTAIGAKPTRNEIIKSWKMNNDRMALFLAYLYGVELKIIELGLYKINDILINSQEVYYCILNYIPLTELEKYDNYRQESELQGKQYYNITNYFRYGN